MKNVIVRRGIKREIDGCLVARLVPVLVPENGRKKSEKRRDIFFPRTYTSIIVLKVRHRSIYLSLLYL